MNTHKYTKLNMKLASKGYGLRAKEIGSFAYGAPVRIGNAKVVGVWAVTVYPPGCHCSNGLYFSSLRQVQRWADGGFKDELLPKIPLDDGTFIIQKKVA